MVSPADTSANSTGAWGAWNAKAPAEVMANGTAWGSLPTERPTSSSSKSRRSPAPDAGHKPPDFVVKLHAMLSELGPDLIRWTDGKIIIKRPPIELEAALPSYFRHGKLTSFQRQLNNFGFHKKTSESTPTEAVYVRDDMMSEGPDALLDICRKVVDENGTTRWLCAEPVRRVTLEDMPPTKKFKGDGDTNFDDESEMVTSSFYNMNETYIRPDVTDKACFDAFTAFLDSQECGNVLSEDAMDLFMSSDLDFDLGMPALTVTESSDMAATSTL